MAFYKSGSRVEEFTATFEGGGSPVTYSYGVNSSAKPQVTTFNQPVKRVGMCYAIDPYQSERFSGMEFLLDDGSTVSSGGSNCSEVVKYWDVD
jgi:hypothetical protein